MAIDDSAGFTVKEILVRVETKVDIAIADHEARLRKIEASDALIEGGITNREKLGAKVLALIAVTIAGGSLAIDTLYFLSAKGGL